MIEAGRGVIVNLSSGWGRSTSPEVGSYCTTKWAIEGLTGSLARELPKGLAAVVLNLGVVDTEMLRSCWGEGAGAYEEPGDWAARAVPFLAVLGPRDNGGGLRHRDFSEKSKNVRISEPVARQTGAGAVKAASSSVPVIAVRAVRATGGYDGGAFGLRRQSYLGL